ncbi:nucleotidyl transferase AbiEii/AbiGii toxin family protein [Methylosinus sp. RM1]|uniref:nucleotidyl transferase AbiEii/AbiGii toxin family protein n=1 Tax=Methylosinus sp. RM1 TaxID=2583817 RepID=UPI001407F30F|nr:nucleotidyl transferase AbiEii/AbiGii toxin family protein [Methylosinus sp. RM1]
MLTPLLDALPAPQRGLWPLLARIPRHYALYGGAAIALRLGHRTSVDFDFFSDVPLDDGAKSALLDVLHGLGRVSVLQNDKNTLTVSVSRDDEPVKLSFFGGMSNGRVGEPEKTADDVLCVASLDDLLAHKLKVIHDRAEGKDYQDIAAMLAAGQSLAHGLAAVRETREAIQLDRFAAMTFKTPISFRRRPRGHSPDKRPPDSTRARR